MPVGTCRKAGFVKNEDYLVYKTYKQMVSKAISCLLIILSLTSYSVLAKDSRTLDCYKGKWKFTEIQHEGRRGSTDKKKKAAKKGQQFSEYLAGGTITFNDKKVTFCPAGDTIVYIGKIEIKVAITKQPSGFGPNGTTYYHSTAKQTLHISFTGDPAKYNFNMRYECPEKTDTQHKVMESNGKRSYTLVRVKE